MFNLERQEEILKLLEKSNSISVNKLSKLLYVSPPTIRRDLTVLEQQGKVRRTHGGVVLRQTAEKEIPLMLREDQNSKAKQIIAKKASEYVNDGDVIFLDASSTVAHIIPYLKRFNDIIVVTNSPKTSMSLGEENIKNYCTGGLLLSRSIAYVGNEAEKFISSINADVFFFSSRGYVEDGHITDSSIEEATVRKAMIKNSDKVFYLCDSSKKNKKYMYNICSTADVTGIIDELP
ncbi:MAG: DeoR/GlpR transcriptional regulator [Clostridia bacterium]|nr:DeoR/GlpR transcriptional regulator [Clostridia bacterium]